MSRGTGTTFLHRWHGLLALPRQSPAEWYQDRLQEEIIECQEAETRLEKLSETADVFFTISRASYDGFPICDLPQFSIRHIHIYAYMLGKFTSRWMFYRALAWLCGAPNYANVREVINPTKDHKLDEVASRHNIDRRKFKRIGRRLRQIWPLFP